MNRQMEHMHLGNFMVSLCLRSLNSTLQCVHKPGLVQYKSPLLQLVETVAFIPMLLLYSGSGGVRQQQYLSIPMLEQAHHPTMPADQAVLSVSTPELQTYSVHLKVETHLNGMPAGLLQYIFD